MNVAVNGDICMLEMKIQFFDAFGRKTHTARETADSFGEMNAKLTGYVLSLDQYSVRFTMELAIVPTYDLVERLKNDRARKASA